MSTLAPAAARTPKALPSLLQSLIVTLAVPADAPTASPLRTTDDVMVTAPKSPLSSASISPPAIVAASAAANVAHGAVLEHGLVSAPVPETNDCGCCARATPVAANASAAATSAAV